MTQCSVTHTDNITFTFTFMHTQDQTQGNLTTKLSLTHSKMYILYKFIHRDVPSFRQPYFE